MGDAISYLLELQASSADDAPDRASDPGHDLLLARSAWIGRVVQDASARLDASLAALPADTAATEPIEAELARRRARLVTVAVQERLPPEAAGGAGRPSARRRRWELVLEHVELLSAAYARLLPELARAVRLYCDGFLSRVRVGRASQTAGCACADGGPCCTRRVHRAAVRGRAADAQPEGRG